MTLPPERAHAGQPWTEEEEAQLISIFHARRPHPSPQELAAAMQRSPAAVVTRLVRLGHLLAAEQGYFLPARYCAFNDLKEQQ